MNSSGIRRDFLLHIPPAYRSAATDRLPLVIALHGYGSRAERMAAVSGWSALADRAGFVVAYAQALGDPSAWDAGGAYSTNRDVIFMRDLIHVLGDEVGIDPARVYVTGHSLGGGMANRVGCELADLVAAIGPVSGAFFGYASCEPTRPMPVVAIHGRADSTVPYSGTLSGTEHQNPQIPVLLPMWPPIHDWANSWAERNGCHSVPTVAAMNAIVTRETWSQCKADATVVLYTIEGWGHNWPAGTNPDTGIDAATVIWEFFASHPLSVSHIDK